MPVFHINGAVIIGFDPEHAQKLLHLLYWMVSTCQMASHRYQIDRGAESVTWLGNAVKE